MRTFQPTFITASLVLAFTSFAQNCAYVVRNDPTFGVSHPISTPSVDVMALHDPDGPGPQGERLYIAGSFDAAGTTPVSGLAWYDLGTGQWSSMGGNMPPGGLVRSMVVSANGDVVIGGAFSDFNGVQVNAIARWNGSAWSGVGAGMTSTSDLRVNALVRMPNGDIVAGGRFTTAGGVATNHIARWNGTTWSPVGTGMNEEVTHLAVGPTGDLYAAGYFTVAGGTPASRIARWNGSAWSALGSIDQSANIYAMTIAGNGDVIASGVSSAASGFSEQAVARWNGAAWSSMGTISNNLPSLLTTLPGGDVLASMGYPGLHRYNGTAWTPFATTLPNQSIKCFAQTANGDIVVGGVFSTWSGPAPRLARLVRPRHCPYLAADFETTTGTNAGWTTQWAGGTGATEIANGRLSSAAGLAAVSANHEVFYTSPPSWAGDHHGLYGGHIRVETQNSIACNGLTGNTFANFVLEGAGMTLVAQSDGVTRLRAQHVHTLAFLPEKWRVGGISGPVATPAELYEVLGDMTAIKCVQMIRSNGLCGDPLGRGHTSEIEMIALHTEPLSGAYNFDQHDAGWTADEDTQDLSWNASGYMSCAEFQNGSYRYWVAPPGALGHHRDLYGGVLAYKMQVTHNEQDLPLPLVEIDGGPLGVLRYFTAQKPSTTQVGIMLVPLSAIPLSNGEGWTHNGGTSTLSEGLMSEMLDSPRSLRIRAEFSTQDDVCILDDVALSDTFSGTLCDPIDFNGDTLFPDTQDITDYLDVFAGGTCPTGTCGDVDFNNDGLFPDTTDIDSLLSVFSGGPCI